MHVRFVACSLAALLAVLMAAPAVVAADDPVFCGSYDNVVRAAEGNQTRLNQLLTHPRAASCPDALAQARAQLRAIQPLSPPPPVVSPPVAPPPRVSPPPSPQRVASLDARTAPASTRAPLVTNPASLPNFALFRECEGCPEMVVIPAGTFTMGSPTTEAGRDADEGPQRNVSIRRFAISRFETTWDQWTACVNAGACSQGPIDTLIGQQAWARDVSNWGRGQRPAIMVNWNDAAAYAIFVRGRAGGAGYRLLTEAEWEYAARAGTSTRWSFGDAESQLGAYAWFTNNAGGKTQPVGGKAPNPWGLFDMHGNVWEWVEDCSNDSLANTPTNGAANTTGSCAVRVYRGGAWFSIPLSLRSANRSGDSPSIRGGDVGFRVARTL